MGFTSNRRQVLASLTSVGIGALVPGGGLQQNARDSKLQLAPKDAGAIHGDMLRKISDSLGGEPINTQQGLFRLIDLLKEWELISETDQQKLKELVSVIFSTPDPEAMAKKIDGIYKEFVDKAGDVAATVISIARSSIEYVLSKAKQHPRAVYIVSSDVGGAIAGATQGRKLGTAAAVIGAVGAGIATSAWAALKAKPQT